MNPSPSESTAPTATTADPGPADLTAAQAAQVAKIKSGANWLFWIAGISIVNTALIHFDAKIKFSLGLGFTEIIYAIGKHLGPVFAYVAFVADAVFLAGLVALGIFATRLKAWAFVVGIVVMSLDTVLLVMLAGTDELMSIGVHIWAVVAMWLSLSALRLHRAA